MCGERGLKLGGASFVASVRDVLDCRELVLIRY